MEYRSLQQRLTPDMSDVHLKSVTRHPFVASRCPRDLKVSVSPFLDQQQQKRNKWIVSFLAVKTYHLRKTTLTTVKLECISPFKMLYFRSYELHKNWRMVLFQFPVLSISTKKCHKNKNRDTRHARTHARTHATHTHTHTHTHTLRQVHEMVFLFFHQ